MEDLDKYRLDCLRAISQVPARIAAWPTVRDEIGKNLGTAPTANEVFALGSQLREVFKSYERSRSQSDLARGGKLWEVLIVWYLNLIFWRTSVVAMCPRKSLLPPVIGEALAVKIKGVVTTKEADVIVFELPMPEGDSWAESGTDLNRDSIDKLIRQNPNDTEVGVIQCKTNWNDNAQIPMLWNALYAAHDLKVDNVAVGINGYTPSSFRRFSYAFATVPTNTVDSFKSNTTAVVRVQGLSGGNYWGRPSVEAVADSISEYFGRNFGHVFKGGVQNHVDKNVLADEEVLKKFLDFDF